MLLLMCLIFPLLATQATHFRGGFITWRALNTTPSGSIVRVVIRQHYSWLPSITTFPCTPLAIISQNLVGSGTGSLTCVAGSCGSYTTITTDVRCTDFSGTANCSTGERYDTIVLNLGQIFTVTYSSSSWPTLAISSGGGIWQITAKINLAIRPDGLINTSPITNILPIFYKIILIQHVLTIPMADFDSTDTLRCRWSTAIGNTNNFGECGSICAPSLPPGFMLFSNNCTLVFTLTMVNYYAVAIQIEDYYTPSASTAMSSIPVQFLFYGRPSPTGCSTPPSIFGVRPNLACVAVVVGVLMNETVIAQVGCPGKSITEFISSSPFGMRKTNINNTSPGIYTIMLQWTPTAIQYGPHIFCTVAVDNTGVHSMPWCITFLVGFTAPNLQAPLLVQGTASPVGTIFANHSFFSIQSVNGVQVNRPWRNGTYINFVDATMNNTVVLSYDCGWSPDVIYTGDTIIINSVPPWIPGHQYYVTFDSGVSISTIFCGIESAPITDPNFWVFDIWDPVFSSTMTSTSTTVPIVTVTTATTTTTTTTTTPVFYSETLRGDSTTTPNPNLTTTGIIASSITTTTSSTTASTISTTTTTLTTATTPSTTSTPPTVTVISSQDYIKACEVPVAVATLLSMIAMVPIKMIAMFTLFTKIHQMRQNIEIAVDQAVRKY